MSNPNSKTAQKASSTSSSTNKSPEQMNMSFSQTNSWTNGKISYFIHIGGTYRHISIYIHIQFLAINCTLLFFFWNFIEVEPIVCMFIFCLFVFCLSSHQYLFICDNSYLSVHWFSFKYLFVRFTLHTYCQWWRQMWPYDRLSFFFSLFAKVSIFGTMINILDTTFMF